MRKGRRQEVSFSYHPCNASSRLRFLHGLVHSTKEMLEATFFVCLYNLKSVRNHDVDNYGVFVCNSVCVCM